MNNEKINENEMLDSPVDELEMSPYFKEISKKMGFKTLRPMAKIGWGKLSQMEDFDYDWFDELISLLKKEGLLELMQRGK